MMRQDNDADKKYTGYLTPSSEYVNNNAVGEVFPLQRPALIQNTTPTQNLGIPTFGSQNRPIKIPLDLF